MGGISAVRRLNSAGVEGSTRWLEVAVGGQTTEEYVSTEDNWERRENRK